MNACVLSMGDELVLGQIQERNAAWISARLAEVGVSVIEHRTVGDDRGAIVEALRELSRRAEVVVTTGGLGPTEDDLLRDSLAELLNEPLVEDAEARHAIERIFAGRRRVMPAINLRQAQRPVSARCLENPNGTAPGLAARAAEARLWSLPGPPAEMKPMFERFVLPELAGGGAKLLIASIGVLGLGESAVAEKLGNLMARDRNPLVGTTASGSVVTVRVRAFGAAATDERGFEEQLKEIERALHPYAFGREQTLPEAVGAALRARGATLALAESCTGGGAGSMVTEVPGSSEWFVGGVMAYSNALKERLLDVPAALLRAHGAVSADVALAMAEGAMRVCQSTCAASITGVAGPSESESKPAGTVFVAVTAGGANAGSEVRRFRFPGDRASVRDRSAKAALQMVRFWLLGERQSPLLWQVS